MIIPVFIYHNCIRNWIIASCRNWPFFNNTTLQCQANETSNYENREEAQNRKSEIGYILCRVIKTKKQICNCVKKFLRCSDDSALVWFPPKDRKGGNGELKCKNSNKKLDVLCRAPPSGNLRNYSYQHFLELKPLWKSQSYITQNIVSQIE